MAKTVTLRVELPATTVEGEDTLLKIARTRETTRELPHDQ